MISKWHIYKTYCFVFACYLSYIKYEILFLRFQNSFYRLFVAAVFILISIAVFAVKLNDQLEGLEFSYHFAFAFCILAMLAGIGAGCMMLVDAIKA